MPCKNINALIVSDNERFSRMLSIELERIGIYSYTGDRELLDDLPRDIHLVLADLDTCNSEELNILENISLREHISLFVGWSRTAEKRFSESDTGYVRLRRPFSMKFLINLISERVLEMDTAQAVEDRIIKKSMRSIVPAHAESSGEKALKSLVVDEERRAARYGEEIIPLSEYEYRVLYMLCERRGEVVSREEINIAVGCEKSNMGDVYVCHLRRKIDSRLGLKLIYTVRGKGYMLK